MISLWVLAGTAVTIALIHTLMGPDHYLPLVILARANRWSTLKTASVTVVCGLGHVLGSVILGGVGIAAGFAITRLEAIESTRGNLASFLLIGFGIAYAAWGFRQARSKRTHSHGHLHTDGVDHLHSHRHGRKHLHLHPSSVNFTMTLFLLFGLGPCEPLIPLLMFPAAVHGASGIFLVTAVFGLVTIATMLGVVLFLRAGLSLSLKTVRLERYAHVMAGLTIIISGIAVRAFGL